MDNKMPASDRALNRSARSSRHRRTGQALTDAGVPDATAADLLARLARIEAVTWRVDYNGLLALALEAIKVLDDRVSALEAARRQSADGT